jgi:hypothetical protein
MGHSRNAGALGTSGGNYMRAKGHLAHISDSRVTGTLVGTVRQSTRAGSRAIIVKSDIEPPWLAGRRKLALFRNAQPLETSRETEPPADPGAAAPGNGGCPASDRARATAITGPDRGSQDETEFGVICRCAPCRLLPGTARPPSALRGPAAESGPPAGTWLPDAGTAIELTRLSYRSDHIESPGCYQRATVRQIASLLSRVTLSL